MQLSGEIAGTRQVSDEERPLDCGSKACDRRCPLLVTRDLGTLCNVLKSCPHVVSARRSSPPARTSQAADFVEFSLDEVGLTATPLPRTCVSSTAARAPSIASTR